MTLIAPMGVWLDSLRSRRNLRGQLGRSGAQQRIALSGAEARLQSKMLRLEQDLAILKDSEFRQDMLLGQIKAYLRRGGTVPPAPGGEAEKKV